MSDGYPTPLEEDGTGLTIGIAAARFNDDLVGPLLERVASVLAASRAAVHTVRVPGSLELPYAALKMAGSKRFDALVVLGVVIAGETRHHEHIADATGYGIQKVSLEQRIPIVNGILVTENREQAEARTTTGMVDKGGHFGRAALELARFQRQPPL